MKPLFRVSVLLLALSALALLAGCVGEPVTLEQRAQRIDAQLMCPICPGETIDQSQTKLAEDMRATVREQLAAGRTEEEIKQFFVDRYDAGILAKPPARGLDLLAWLVPVAAVALGAALVWTVLRAMARRPAAQAAASSPSAGGAGEGDLAAYLARVDALTRDGQEDKGKAG